MYKPIFSKDKINKLQLWTTTTNTVISR